MKIKVNKSRWLDDSVVGEWLRELCGYGFNVTPTHNTGEFEVEDVTSEQLMDYIRKGYGIKINC